MGLKDFIKSDLNNLLYREYRLNRKVKRYLSPYYNEQEPVGKNEKKIIIFMADGQKKTWWIGRSSPRYDLNL